MQIITVLIAKEHGAGQAGWTCACDCCQRVRAALYGVKQVLSTVEKEASASPSHEVSDPLPGGAGESEAYPGPAVSLRKEKFS